MSYTEHWTKTTRLVRNKQRTVVIPSPWLKEQQRSLLPMLQELRVHSAAHGYVKGRNVESAVKPHNNRQDIVCMDIKGFFNSIRSDMVYSALRANNIPMRIANEVVALTCYEGRLPFGAVTSPCLSNIVFYPVDTEIGIYCENKMVTYTRYADDMVFSADHILTEIFVGSIEIFLYRYGYTTNRAKTRHQPKRVLGKPVTYVPF